ncbi:MAG: CDP-diacylglycerol--serine O-phosphatidyltransferase [Candidatus Paracaedibacteraceae bacterium]|nr:CDP-diacylglycerol--serine O-phosphatidyltransferase [Candidatus Paracaedibacteraceae bacterium]
MYFRRSPEQFRRKPLRARIPERFRQRKKLKAQSLTAMIPNITTLMALCCGMTAIRFALLEKWELAIVSVLLAAILDTLDGRLARLLNSASRFGAELDSFSDFLSFGIAPALIMYLKGLSDWGETGWAIALFFTVCMALRLARFNVMSLDEDQPDWLKGFSTGVPAPAGGFLAFFPIVLQYALPKATIFQHTCSYAFFMMLASILMVSRIPTFTLKKLVVPSTLVLPFLLTLFIAVGLIYSYPWHMLALIGVLYLALIPFSIRYFKKCEIQSKLKNETVEEELV